MIFKAGDACQKDRGDCFRKSLIPWTAVADLSLGQNDSLSAHAGQTLSFCSRFSLACNGRCQEPENNGRQSISA